MAAFTSGACCKECYVKNYVRALYLRAYYNEGLGKAVIFISTEAPRVHCMAFMYRINSRGLSLGVGR